MSEQYKDTELGKIPVDWEIKKIYELGDIITGSTPKTSERQNYGNDYLWVSPIDIGYKKYITNTTTMLSEIGYKKTRKLPKGSVLVVCIGSTIGKVGIAGHELSTNQQINGIICKNEFYNEYVYYAIIYNFKRYFSYISIQAVPIINKSTFSNFEIPIPPFSEQQKIADILSTVDQQIEQIDALIGKTKELKKGLMQKLLTKGIGHTEFKKTEVGEIPVEWEVAEIKDVAEIVSGGTPSTKINTYWKDGNIYWATPTDITSNKRKYINKTERCITEEGLKNSAANLLPAGSILMTSRATIGEACVNTVPMATNQGFKSLVCKDIVDNEFMYYMIDRIKEGLKKLSAGSTYLEISSSAVANYKISLPSIHEQRKIVSILDSADEQIYTYESKKHYLQFLKKGLMQKLLTGKIRVNVSEEDSLCQQDLAMKSL